jgi:hypothetical protein
MDKQSECIKVKARDGKVLLSIYPGKDVLIEGGPQNGANQGKEAKDNKGGNGNGNSRQNGNGDSMTFPQKKFLFRLLAGQGIEGDKAQERLKELFKVDHLKDVGKMEASRMIERLLKESKGGDNRESSVG